MTRKHSPFARFGMTLLFSLVCFALLVLAGCKPEVGPPAPPTASAAPSDAIAQVAASAASVPRAALPYRSELIRTARMVWGMDAPIASFAGQVHQESGWRADAVSRVGAQGMAQFMPSTAKWIAGIDPQLRDAQPLNPAWAMRALVTYDQWLYVRTPADYAPRDRMWVALRSYNGGLGNWQQEAARAGGPKPTREQVDAACGKARRAAVHCTENLGYPQRILGVLQHRYASWGPVL